jgi:DNA primase
MSTPVETIKERLSIDEVIGSYVKLERSGQNFKARCPFHNEKTPSFYVSPNRGGYYCFGCGAKGDIFTFVESFEGLDFKGALKILADKAGVELVAERPGARDERERLFAIMEAAAQYFETALSQSPSIQKYILDRGVTEETMRTFRLGYAPEGWRNLALYLQSIGYTLQEIETAGLGKKPQDEEKTERGLYDRFRGRIMFPINDSSGRIIAFSGRIVVDDGASAKYLNSPETPLFDKSSTLYGLDRAKETIRRLGYAILVEGQFDLVLAHQSGTKNVVAASGTALTDDEGETGSRGIANMKMLARLCKNIVLSFDGDSAGIRAAYRGTRLAFSLGMDVKIAPLPQGKDPADIVREGGDSWHQILRTTVSALTFFLEHLKRETPDEKGYLKRVRDEILPIIALMPSAVEQEHALRELERQTGTTKESWQHDLSLILREPRPVAHMEKKSTLPAFTRASDRLFGLIAWQQSLESPSLDVNACEKAIIDSVGEERYHKLKDAASERIDALVFQAEAAFHDGRSITEEAQMLTSLLAEEGIREELKALMPALRRAENMHDPSLSSLLEQHRSLTLKLEELHRKRHDA